jgi:hypothetical protein
MASLAELDSINGTVVLRGHTVQIDSDVGAAFVLDVCRHVESLLSADQLRAKYGLTDDEAYAGLGENKPLQRAIAAAKVRRIHDGSASREKAQHKFLTAPDVLDAIIHDPGSAPRNKIDAVREMRAIAQVVSETSAAAERERFIIHLNFGTNKVVKEFELKAVKPELTVEAGNEEQEGEYGF